MKSLIALIALALVIGLVAGCSPAPGQAPANAPAPQTDANGNQTDPTAKPADPGTGTGSEGIRSVPPNSPGQR